MVEEPFRPARRAQAPARRTAWLYAGPVGTDVTSGTGVLACSSSSRDSRHETLDRVIMRRYLAVGVHDDFACVGAAITPGCARDPEREHCARGLADLNALS